jgi:spoIIIJ-associated protein
MKTFKREGKSEASVVTAFMKEFGLKRSDFTYDIIDEGSKGFFSLFGSKPVIIRFNVQGGDDGDVKTFLDGLFEHIGVEYQKMDVQRRGRNISINITGASDRGYMIGKEGRMLESIQHLAYRYLMKNEKEEINVRLDIDGYRRKHEKMLTDYLQEVIDKVKKTGKGISLDPLYTSDRKFVYRLLEKETAVKSVTQGTGQKKKIMIVTADAVVEDTGEEGEGRPRGERSDRSRGPRTRSRRPRNDRPPREASDTPTETNGEPRPRSERPPRERSPRPERTSTDRPENERPDRPDRERTERPQGDRPQGERRNFHPRHRPRPRREPRPEGEPNGEARTEPRHEPPADD